MTCHYAYTNAKLSSPMQQKGNGTMPTIKWTPLKTNTPTISANKVDGATTGNPIAVSIWKIKSEKKKNKTMKEKKIRMQRTTRRDMNCDVPKLIYWLPKLWMATAISEDSWQIWEHGQVQSHKKLQRAHFVQMQWSWFNTRQGKTIHTKALWLWLCRKKQSNNWRRNRTA